MAKLLDMSTRHFYRLVRAGHLPKGVNLGKTVRWDRNATRQALAKAQAARVKRKDGETDIMRSARGG